MGDLEKLVQEMDSWDWWQQSRRKGNKVVPPGADWEKWSHGFNKNIRKKVVDARAEENTELAEKFTVLFRMWQLQYRLATLKLGLVVGQRKKRELIQAYDKSKAFVLA